MAQVNYNIFEIEPQGLSGFKPLSSEDIDLITSTEITKTFKPNDNFIELSFFTLDNTRLQTISTYDRYSILSGDKRDNLDGNTEIGLDVQEDYLAYGYGTTEVKLLYNFLDYPYSNTTLPQDFYIESISPDRTELRLVSVNLDGSTVLETTNKLKQDFENSAYIPDLHLYLGSNIFFSIVNIDAKEFRETTAVLVKLLEPLPRTITTKSTLNIVEKVSDSIAYEVNAEITPDKEPVPTLRGANFAIDLQDQSTEPSQYYNYQELFSFASNNTYRELNSLFNEKGAEIGIDYSDFANFINFSSAEERLRNFKYKLELIESYQTNLDNIQGNVTSPPLGYTGQGVTGTTQYWKKLIEGILNNFDHYERHLFYEKGNTAWPKDNPGTSKPYINLNSADPVALAWYNTQLQDAVLYDAQNGDLLTNTVPSYLIEDPDNRPYELIVHMVAQHFDNLWIYTNHASKKYDADNRLDSGVSKDLVEDLLKNFGVKLYTSNKSVEDLFRYFTTNSYDTGNEIIPHGNLFTSGQESVSQNDYQKEIYKRIYHNLPLLMKSKGTERGLRALITCFGIPSDVLKVRVFGGESSEEFPFYGGQQAITGSIDKVRLNNTGSIVPGDTVSFYTSVINSDNFYTQDLHRIEVGFSPAYNINEYIVSQSAVLFPNTPFDIDDYIGDPRGYETNKYPPLYEYAEGILVNVDAYNLKDFVRLIKFFDNVLFRMVRDFTPARAVTDAGIIIKPHLLDRSKFKSPEMTWTRPEYSGSIDTAFISGSHGNSFRSGSSEYSTAYSQSVATPTGIKIKKWVPYIGDPMYARSFEEAKYDGEFSGSLVTVSTGELNDENTVKTLDYQDVRYNIRFYTDVPEDACVIQGLSLIATENPATFNVTNLFTDIQGGFEFTGEEEVQFQQNLSADTVATISFLQQYDTVSITATNDSLDSNPNQAGIQPCTATTEVTLVECNVALNQSVPQIQVNTPYDLNQLFVINDNTDYSIIVDGVTLTPAEAANYVFTNEQGGIPVGIKFQDNVDNSCQVTFDTTIDGCSLTTPLTDTREWTVFQMDKYPDQVTPSSRDWNGDEFFNLNQIFPGATANTQFEISFSNLGPEEQSPWFAVDGYTFGNSAGVFFPTNFRRLTEDYPYFNNYYTTPSNNALFNEFDGSINLPNFAIYFRAVQNADCNEGDDYSVVWHPFQDDFEEQQWQGPIAARKLWPMDLLFRPPAPVDENNFDGTITNTDDYQNGVCDPLDQAGNVVGIRKTVYTSIPPQQGNEGWNNTSWFEILTPNFNGHEERQQQTTSLVQSAFMFEDPRGIEPLGTGIYTDYTPTSQYDSNENVGYVEFSSWARYDYFFRPIDPTTGTEDKYVATQGYQLQYFQDQLPGCPAS